jgi:hypothetical protein
MEKPGWRSRVAGKVRRGRAALNNDTIPLDGPSSLPLNGDQTKAEFRLSTHVINSVAEVDVTSVTVDAPASTRPPSTEQFELVQLDGVDGDTKRTSDRYTSALHNLKRELNRAQGDGKLFQLPELENIPNNLEPIQLREAINRALESSAASARNPSKWAKCKRVIEAVYTALSPFLKNVLKIMIDAQAVC